MRVGVDIKFFYWGEEREGVFLLIIFLFAGGFFGVFVDKIFLHPPLRPPLKGEKLSLVFGMVVVVFF